MRSEHEWRLEENTKFGASTGCKSQDGAINRGLAYHRRVYDRLRLHTTVSMPGWRLLVEPWFKNRTTHRLCSPDAVLIDDARQVAIVVEAKMNWKDGRDVKLLDLYLGVVQSAFKLEAARPMLIAGCIRGLRHAPLLSLGKLETALDWRPGQPTPTMLLLK